MSSFGEELARERELRRITLREVAEATKINLRYLEALEQNDFKHLPGGIFNRGFVKAYAQYIGIDADAMVNAYLLEEKAQEAAEPPGDGALLRGSGVGSRSSGAPAQGHAWNRSGMLPLWLLALVGLVLVIMAVWLFYPDSSDEAPDPQESSVGKQTTVPPSEESQVEVFPTAEEEPASEKNRAAGREDGS